MFVSYDLPYLYDDEDKGRMKVRGYSDGGLRLHKFPRGKRQRGEHTLRAFPKEPLLMADSLIRGMNMRARVTNDLRPLIKSERGDV